MYAQCPRCGGYETSSMKADFTSDLKVAILMYICDLFCAVSGIQVLFETRGI